MRVRGIPLGVKLRDDDPFAAARTAEIRDDPFARAALSAERGGASGAERSDTLLGRLAQLDPSAPVETTGVLVEGSSSIEDLLRGARRLGFLAGLATGVLLAAGGAAALWWTFAP